MWAKKDVVNAYLLLVFLLDSYIAKSPRDFNETVAEKSKKWSSFSLVH